MGAMLHMFVAEDRRHPSAGAPSLQLYSNFEIQFCVFVLVEGGCIGQQRPSSFNDTLVSE